MTDIREQAAQAARDRATRGQRPNIDLGPGDAILIEALTEMYLAGYEAAKAEAFECPGDTRTCPAFIRGECKGTEAEWNDESCEAVRP